MISKVPGKICSASCHSHRSCRQRHQVTHVCGCAAKSGLHRFENGSCESQKSELLPWLSHPRHARLHRVPACRHTTRRHLGRTDCIPEGSKFVGWGPNAWRNPPWVVQVKVIPPLLLAWLMIWGFWHMELKQAKVLPSCPCPTLH